VIWDLAANKELRRVPGYQYPGQAVAFSADSQKLAVGDGGNIRVWDVNTGKPIVKLRRHTGNVTSVAFSPDGKNLASGGADNAVRLWDLETGKELQQIGHPNTRRATEHFVMELNNEITCVAFSPDGKTLFSTVKDDRFLRAWDVVTGKELRRFEGHVGGCLSMALSADGHTLVAGSGDSCIRLWDADNGKELFPANGHRGRIFNLGFVAGGKALMSAGRDGRLRIWDLASGKQTHQAGDDTDFIGFMAVSADGRIAASTRQDDETIHLWDMATGKLVRDIDCPHRGVMGAAFSADGKTLASLGAGDLVTLWEVATGKELRHWTARPEQGNQVIFLNGGGLPAPLAFSRDGKLLATSAFDSNFQSVLHLWDTSNGKHVRQISVAENQGDNLLRILFAPGDRVVATVGGQNTINLWDVTTGKVLYKLDKVGTRHPQGMVNLECVAFSPDGQTLAAVGPDSKVIVWDVATGKEVAAFETDQGWIGSVAYSPDSRTIAAGGLDTTVLLLDVTDLRGAAPALGRKELEERWKDLLDEAGPGFKARWALALSPEQSVPFLREHLRPVEAVPKALLDRLLADLDSKQFNAREKATEELEKRGELVLGALRTLRASKPPLEVQKRVDGILQKITTVQLTSDRLRDVRAILVLEQAGTPAARQLLEEIARGVSEARLTQEAKAALERTKGREMVAK
jgi:WD40 repeat protein